MAIKILWNFDTWLKQQLLDENINEYGKPNVLLVRKGPVFFLFRILLPIISYLIVLLIFLTFIYITFRGFLDNSLLYRILIWFSVLYIFSTGYDIFITYIDYNLSFFIVNPDSIISYTQKGVFTRKSATIKNLDIKSIRTEKVWFLNSLFDMGIIVFLLEWDQKGELMMTYIMNPELVQEKIEAIIKIRRWIRWWVGGWWIGWWWLAGF